jgi:hypothetical protein
MKKVSMEESTGEFPSLTESDDKNESEEKTVTIDATTGEKTVEPAPPPKPTVDVKRLQSQLETENQELEEVKKKMAVLQASQNIDDIPELVDSKIGPIEIKNLSKISGFDRRGYLSAQYLQGIINCLILPIAMTEQKLKATRARVAKMNTLLIGDSRQSWISDIFDKPWCDYKSKFNMISKATLENAKGVSEKILLIADEGMKKVVLGEEPPRTPKAEIKAERISELYNNTNSCKNSQCRNRDKLLNFILG